MSNGNEQKNYFSWKDNKVIIIALVVFLVLGFVYYVRRAVETPKDQVPEGITLTPEQEEALFKSMSAAPDSKPSISEEEFEELSESMSAAEDSSPSVSADEMQKLLQSMSAK